MSLSSLSPATLSPIDRAGAAYTPTSTSLHDSFTPTQRPAAKEVPNELLDLRRRTTALQAERDHLKQLGERAADAFEDHRRDLTQLAQKERAIRAYREDALREQLQEALRVNRDLMARLVEQRQQEEAAWRAELQTHRDGNTQRHAELETLLSNLHAERDALQKSVAGAEDTRDAVKKEVEACLEEQAHLQERLRLVRDGVAAASEKVTMVDRREDDDDVTRRVSARRQPCCECCDVPQGVWRGPSPTRRVPRRRFVPAGPSGVSRAASPTTTHHIDALLSGIERENYLRPRLYYQRCGRELPPPPRMASPQRFIARDDVGGLRHAGSPLRWSPLIAQQRNNRHDCPNCSQGLSSTTASLTSSRSRGDGTNTSFMSSQTSSSSATASVPTHNRTASGSCGTPTRRSTQRATSSVQAASSPAERRSCSLQRCVDVGAYPRTSPTHLPRVQQRQGRHCSPERHGSALNAVCRSLLTDLAEARASYQRYQLQLRDPLGDSVQASQEMRRLMRRMDERVGQIRAMRREQERHRDPLRVHDVLRQVLAENQYCEAVYRDLVELIRA